MSATTTRNAKADAALALLCERWSKCCFMFQGRRLPLKIGIHKDIPDGLIEPKMLRLVFRLYINNPGYLNAMRLGAARVDLNGEVAGTVDENDAKSAQAHLAGIRKAKESRKQKRKPSAPTPEAKPAPPPRDGLAGLRQAARARRSIRMNRAQEDRGNGQDPDTIPSASRISFTVFKTDDRLSKLYRLAPDGSVKTDSGTRFAQGSYRVAEFDASDPVGALGAIGRTFDGLLSNQAIGLGAPCPSSDDLRPIRHFEKGGSGSSGVRV